MEHLEGYLNSTGKDAAATMCPNQTMLVAAVRLGISDARGISSAFSPVILLLKMDNSPRFLRVVDIVFST